MKIIRFATIVLACSTLTLVGATVGCEREEPAAPPQTPERTDEKPQWPQQQPQQPERENDQQDDQQPTWPQDGQY